MAITLNGTTGITTPAVTNEGAYTGDGVSFADTTPANTLVTTTGGNVGIGTSSPNQRLDVRGSGAIGIKAQSSDSSAQIILNSVSGGISYVNYGQTGANSVAFYDSNAGAERMRIDSSGNLLVGTTSPTYGEKLSVQNSGGSGNGALFYYTSSDDRSVVLVRAARASGGTSANMINFLNSSGTGVGGVFSTGSATSYSTSSDYRLKENIAPMTGALAVVGQLKPCTYTWKADGSSGQGFIAHELQAVVPDAVVGEKDAVNEDGSIKPQGIDTSFLVATLTAAIQEQQAIITDLKARIETLENK